MQATAANDASPRWYCLRALPRREHIAALHLQDRTGLDVFAPRVAVRRSSRARAVIVQIEALFPGYLFARFHFGTHARLVGSTQGITGIVRRGDIAPPVGDEVIAYLRAQVGGPSPLPVSPVFSSGDVVAILAGCFAGEEGRILRFDRGRDRALVLLSLLGRDLAVGVPVGFLRRAGPALVEFPPALLAGSA
jgi:transcriptional antiterminator RfaH